MLGQLKIPLEIVIGCAGGLVMFLILAHVGLLMVNVFRLNYHKGLKKQWDVILPAKENVDKVLQEMRELQAKHKAIEKITTDDRISWSQKMNILSDGIVRGVWLTRVRLKEGVFFIEGSAISKQNDEMINVHSFTSNLKNEKSFLEKFSDLELGSIQRRNIGKTEIADFLITAELVKETDGE
ncbi:MAG TPA: hypothetical protein VI749_00965 [Candidatus Omnitrophota bacterium]|nr:hypothetical protein [Candidatus Omnitrophota bacterium]